MSKYKTKPIDFTGCHPVIAEHLKRGEAVLCKVSSYGTKEYITGYDRASEHRYLVPGNAWMTAEPVETKLYWRKASEIVRWLENNGYSPNLCGVWTKEGDKGKFHPEWLHFCGTEADESQICHKPEFWFEER